MAKVASTNPRDPDVLHRRELVVDGQEMTVEPTDAMTGAWGISNSTAGPEDSTIDLGGQFHPSRKRGADA